MVPTSRTRGGPQYGRRAATDERSKADEGLLLEGVQALAVDDRPGGLPVRELEPPTLDQGCKRTREPKEDRSGADEGLLLEGIQAPVVHDRLGGIRKQLELGTSSKRSTRQPGACDRHVPGCLISEDCRIGRWAKDQCGRSSPGHSTSPVSSVHIADTTAFRGRT